MHSLHLSLSVFAAALVSTASLPAETYTWQATSGTVNWDAVGAWNGAGNTTYPNAIGDVAQRTSGNSAVATNNIAGGVTAGSLTLGGTATSDWQIANTGNTITLNQDGAGAGAAYITNSSSGSTSRLYVNGGSLVLADDLVITNSGSSAATGGSIMLNTLITGAGNITINNVSNNINAGQIRLNGQSNTFVGNVRIGSGAVVFNIGTSAGNSSLGSSSNIVTLGQSGGGSATLMSNRTGNLSLANEIVVAANSGGTLALGATAVNASSSLATTYSGAVTLQGNLSVISTNKTAEITATTVFTGGITGAGNLTITGDGTTNIGGANNYTGATTVNSGATLALTTNTTNNISKSSVIDVASGGVMNVTAVSAGFRLASGQSLVGGGRIMGNVAIDNGAILAAGHSIGTLTFDDTLSLLDGSLSLFEIDGFSSGLYDLVAGGAGIQAVQFDGELNLVFESGFNTVGSTKIFDFESYSGSFDSIHVTGLAAGYSASFDALTGTINVIAAPEPTSAALLILAASLLLLRSNRPRRTLIS